MMRLILQVEREENIERDIGTAEGGCESEWLTSSSFVVVVVVVIVVVVIIIIIIIQ
jgi:hypothetical protein